MTRKVALVTGSSKRIGKAICELLAQHGYSIALHYHRSQPEAAALQAALRKQNVETSLHCADQSSLVDIERMAAEVAAHWGRLDLLVNSASIFKPTPTDTLTAGQFDEFLTVNAKGPLWLCKSLFTLLRQSAPASVVNISDIYARKPLSNHLPYCASKAALEMITRSLAKEWARHGITVNSIAPGAILFPEGMDELTQKKIVANIPLARRGEPADIAHAVLFLANARYITGHCLAVDGGRTLTL